jgi:hypothetical protein
MLDLARVNAWPHLSARTSQEVMDKVTPSAPCSFCLRGLHQTSVHCLVSGACSAFQDLKVGRHTDIVHKLVQFLTMCTSFSHVVSTESPIRPEVFRSNQCIDHNTPDVVVQDPSDGHVLVLDVTVVSPSRMAHGYSSKMTAYAPLASLIEQQGHSVRSTSRFAVKPVSCEVVPVVFSVFGDFHDDSFALLKSFVHSSSVADTVLAPFLSASCIAIASCASAVASASAKLYGRNRSGS